MPLRSDGDELPFAYRYLVEQGLTRFGPWYLIEDQAESDGFRAEFVREVAVPNSSRIKDFQPFARHAACDDFAGFVLWQGRWEGRVSPEVVVVHLTFSGKPETPGYPGMTRYPDVWAWLSECVLEEMRLVVQRLEEHHARLQK